MKPEHLAEATKLTEAIRVTKEQHHQLSIADKLDVCFFNRRVSIGEDDPKFANVKQSMLTFLDLRLAAQYRRANQIGLNIQPVVLEQPKPVSIKTSAPNLVHSMDEGPKLADEIEDLFGKGSVIR